MAEEGANDVHSLSSATGLVYDERLTRHYCAWNPAYTERPKRLKECYSRVQQLHLVDRCTHVPVRPAKDEEVALCHTQQHMALLKETQTMGTQQLGELSRSYDFIYFHQTVEENARLALGGSIDLVDKVLSGQLQNGMALIRPPGHHAMTQQFCGYCYFNNVAVVARTALNNHGLKRILIVDWDVHHGQGTQFDFYSDPRVLYFSIHRYEHGAEWPHLRESDYDYCGEGAGKGFNINVPLNENGCDNSDYLSIFFNLLLPVAYEFQPELVLVSAGYDSAIGCPEGEMNVTPACFAHFVQLLKPLAAGKLVLLLEGGYCIRTLAEGAALSLRALLGEPTPNIQPLTQPKLSVVESVLNVITVHQSSHPCLAFQQVAKEGMDHTFHWQSSPPRSPLELRTRYKQPSEYPLIQECYDPVAEAIREALKKEIEQLEKDTLLVSTKHRMGICHYHMAGSENGKIGSLEEVLSQRGLLSGCLKLPTDQPKDLSTLRATVSAALAAIVNNTVQTCALIPCCAGTEGVSAGRYREAVQCVAHCLQSDFHVKRTLYLNLLSESQPLFQSQVSTENNSRSLVISLGGCSTTDQLASSEPSSVSIPLHQGQWLAADVMAAVHQVILPIAYEFGPDFVVVCLDSLQHNMDEDQSVACLGHLMTLLQSLAMGRLIFLPSPSAVQGMTDSVAECVSALQGRPCKVLAPCIPHSSAVEVIRGVQDKEKTSWNMLKFREMLPPPPQPPPPPQTMAGDGCEEKALLSSPPAPAKKD